MHALRAASNRVFEELEMCEGLLLVVGGCVESGHTTRLLCCCQQLGALQALQLNPP